MAGAAERQSARGRGTVYQKPIARREETNAALARAIAGTERRMAREAVIAHEAQWQHWRACWGKSPGGG
jgi:hypothetical protein